jgi:carboxylesterase
MASPVIPECEPWSKPGGPHGVLVLHGFTGCPHSMRPVAEAFAAAGYAVELPLLPGHGTSVDDMLSTSWDDWSAAAEAAYQDLASRCDKVAVAGLSMGGSLTVWLATRHPEIVGIVCVNPAMQVAEEMVAALEQLVEAGEETIPSIGGDIAHPDSDEIAYDAAPLRPLLSLAEATARFGPQLNQVACPVLIMTSPQDHVVPPTDSDVLAAGVTGPVERITLERSYHVATLDYDGELITTEAVAFVDRLMA